MTEPVPFQSVGPVARWRVLYELIRPLKVGEILTYQAMGDALGLDPDQPEERHILQMAARRALKELLNNDFRGSKAVKNVGYRVAKPGEHLVLATDRNKKAGRQIKAGYDAATKVDLSGVDPDVRRSLGLLAEGFSRQGEINRRVLAKQEQHDEAIDLLMKRVENLEKSD